MRFLGTGKDLWLGDMYLRLQARGHEVRVQQGVEGSLTLMGGLLTRVPDWHSELSWLREAGDDGFIIVEGTDIGAEQDALRREGFRIIGSSEFGDRLEVDRAFGQSSMRAAGMQTASTEAFSDYVSAENYVRRRPRRYVLKLTGDSYAQNATHVGSARDGADIAALIGWYARAKAEEKTPRILLMDHLDGVEVGVGGYFNGECFMDAVVIDFEHKRFFPGDLGENTHEMGTLISYEHSRPLFDATLAKMAPQLREGGYVGYINLNTIVNDNGIWPLEFTSRFGYPGFAICDAMHVQGWDDIFQKLCRRDTTVIKTHPGFGIGVTLTLPPFPYAEGYEKLSKGLPVFFRDDITQSDRDNLHYGEVEMKDGTLLASGEMGYLMVATGRGLTVEAARENAYATTQKIVVPNLRYRTDIGSRFATDSARLKSWDLWPD